MGSTFCFSNSADAAFNVCSRSFKALRLIERSWAIMPLMHSEALADQEEGVAQYKRIVAEAEARGAPDAAKAMNGNVVYAEKHLQVIKDCGRFPHRNKFLGRVSTPAEVEYLKANPGFA